MRLELSQSRLDTYSVVAMSWAMKLTGERLKGRRPGYRLPPYWLARLDYGVSVGRVWPHSVWRYQPILANAPADGCLTYAVATFLGLHPPGLRRRRHSSDRVGFKSAAAVLRAGHHENRSPAEHPVERAKQGIVSREELAPETYRHVVGCVTD